MAAILEKVMNMNSRKWECKQCHRMIEESDTVAYHLVDQILYGWCEACFQLRRTAGAEPVAA
jgi:late competence protein required for DNA uptake (superfamily II DNA/RNA helicase)